MRGSLATASWRRRKSLAVCAVLTAVVIGLGALSSSGAAAVPSKTDAALATAQAAVAKYSQLPSPIVLPPIGKKVPKNKTIAFISVPTPSIQPLNDGILDGAKALGWKVDTETPSSITPSAFISALQSVVTQKPSALVFFTPFPLSSFQSELTELKAEGVAIVTAGAATYPVGGSSPVLADTSGANIFGPLAKLLAQADIVSAGGKPNVAWVVDPSVPAWTVMTTDFEQTIRAAGGTVGEIPVPEADIGVNSGSVIVDYLEAHPAVKYLSLVVGAYDTGLETALQNAGLADKVKISDTDAATTDIAGVKDGQLSSTIVIETSADGWRLIDLVARILTHTKLPYIHCPSDFLYITKKNVSLANNIYGFPNGFQKSFLTAWGLK